MQNFDRIFKGVDSFQDMILSKKAGVPEISWYPYHTFGNFYHLQPLITKEIDDLLGGGKHIADIGAADGDLSFYMESLGNTCDIIDLPATNYNGLKGARKMRELLGSSVGIYEKNLDKYFEIDASYDLIFFLGILYHLKNPFYVLEYLATKSKYLFLSTRVARFMKSGTQDASNLSLAYLLDADESNGDATNFWVFTLAGLHRIYDRAGWDVVASQSVGDIAASNPQDGDHDERAYSILKSRTFRDG